MLKQIQVIDEWGRRKKVEQLSTMWEKYAGARIPRNLLKYGTSPRVLISLK